MPLTRFARSIGTSLRRIHLYRVTIAELSQLGDRELADLGIARHEIREVARRTAI
ncbi:MAG: DUF1127 domain-containing protein [Siculibacillus sp.]|nr:DUF1127 domain-containing protein [Siculibacillus sp.]